ncbi:hypothetical protein ACSUZJ_08445 [Telluria sp. B2]
MDFKLKKMMEMVGPSAALAYAAWRLMQLLEQRHDAACTRYRELVEAFRQGAAGDIGLCRTRTMHVLNATNIGMMAAFLLLLSLTISTLDAVFKADWLKLFGAPLNMLRLLLVIPAAILVIVDNTMTRKRQGAGLGDLGGRNGQQQAGAPLHSPERRRARAPHGQCAPAGQ